MEMVMQLGRQPAGAEVGVEFGCGIRGVNYYFLSRKIAAGGHVGLKLPHFVDVAMRLVWNRLA